MLRIWTLVVMVLVGSRSVEASPNTKKDLQAGFQKFLDSITDDPKTAMIQGTQIILLPDGSGVMTSPTGLAVKDVLGQPGKVTWKVKVVHAALATVWDSASGSIGADVDVLDAKSKKKLAALRVSAQMLRDEPAKPWTVLAVQFGVPLSDDATGARALAGTEGKLSALPAGPAPTAPKDADVRAIQYAIDHLPELTRDKLGEWLAPAGVMLGSAPGQNVKWSNEAEKAIKRWKLELVADGKPIYGGSSGGHGAAWAAMNVKVKRTYKGKPIEHAYRALFLYQVMVSGEGGNIDEQLDIVQFASPR